MTKREKQIAAVVAVLSRADVNSLAQVHRALACACPHGMPVRGCPGCQAWDFLYDVRRGANLKFAK